MAKKKTTRKLSGFARLKKELKHVRDQLGEADRQIDALRRQTEKTARSVAATIESAQSALKEIEERKPGTFPNVMDGGQR